MPPIPYYRNSSAKITITLADAAVAPPPGWTVEGWVAAQVAELFNAGTEMVSVEMTPAPLTEHASARERVRGLPGSPDTWGVFQADFRDHPAGELGEGELEACARWLGRVTGCRHTAWRRPLDFARWLVAEHTDAREIDLARERARQLWVTWGAQHSPELDVPTRKHEPSAAPAIVAPSPFVPLPPRRYDAAAGETVQVEQVGPAGQTHVLATVLDRSRDAALVRFGDGATASVSLTALSRVGGV